MFSSKYDVVHESTSPERSIEGRDELVEGISTSISRVAVVRLSGGRLDGAMEPERADNSLSRRSCRAAVHLLGPGRLVQAPSRETII